MTTDVSALPSERLLSKIKELSPEKMSEVEDFVDFLRERSADRELTRAAARSSEAAFAAVWDNSDDAAYDRL